MLKKGVFLLHRYEEWLHIRKKVSTEFHTLERLVVSVGSDYPALCFQPINVTYSVRRFEFEKKGLWSIS